MYIVLTECPFNKYGVNCAKTCDCVNANECNPATGCICKNGYTGTYCETDIDECAGKN